MKKLDRLIISSVDKEGKYHAVLNPPLVYFDSSAWIDILNAYSARKENVIREIRTAIGDTTFRILFSLINFHELIGQHGDISQHFSKESIEAIQAPILSALIPPMIIDQEVARFLDRRTDGVRILDPSHVALRSVHKASKEKEAGSTAWLSEQRQLWDEMLERDRVLELEADVWEHSGITPSPSQVIKLRNDILSGSLQIARQKRAWLAKKKQAYKQKHIPPEQKEIVRCAGHRITEYIGRKYGEGKVRMLLSNPRFIFPGQRDLITHVVEDLRRASRLTLPIVRDEMPGLYWNIKVTYYNYYRGRQGESGQSGDRNHAVYIPYSNYFATCDSILKDAVKSEYPIEFKTQNLELFRIA